MTMASGRFARSCSWARTSGRPDYAASGSCAFAPGTVRLDGWYDGAKMKLACMIGTCKRRNVCDAKPNGSESPYRT